MRRGSARYEAALCRRRYHREVEAMADSLNVRRLLRMLRAVCVMVRVGAHDSERMDARERVCARVMVRVKARGRVLARGAGPE